MAFIPTICGNKSNITLPTGSCGGITFEGVEDTTVNQGEGIDLMDGVTAYDEDGNEIPVTVSPTEIAKCDVGEHTVEYKAIGKGGNLKPYLPCGKGKLTVADCGISVETTERVITITQADPPTISGVETLSISVGTLVDLMDGVSAVDDNGNTVEVEFLGGAVDDVAESDDVASFETDLDVPLKSLKLTLEPQQPCTPWIGTDHDTTPYLNRAMPTQSNDYNRESGVIVGGTIAWNQLVASISETRTAIGLTLTNNNDKSLTITGTATSSTRFRLQANITTIPTIDNHVYYVSVGGTLPSTAFIDAGRLHGNAGVNAFIRKPDTDSTDSYIGIYAQNGATFNATYVPIIVDLIAMFGSTIADYIYNLEQANAGAGVAWFRKFFPADYYEYSAGELISVEGLESHDTVGFNQMPVDQLSRQSYNTNVGTKLPDGGPSATVSGVNPITMVCGSWQGAMFNGARLVAGQAYEYRARVVGGSPRVTVYTVDKDNVIRRRLGNWANDNAPTTVQGVVTAAEGDEYIAISISSASAATVTVQDLCVHLIWSGYRNGEYEEYVKHSYLLDNSITLRGIPKLDASNNLYYDGDTYASDGTVTRKYGIVDLGTLDWTTDSGNTNTYKPTTNFAKAGVSGEIANCICGGGYSVIATSAASNLANKTYYMGTAGRPLFKDDSYITVEAFKTAMSGVYLVYELATPTTEIAQPYTNPQVVDPDGMEEYVTANSVPVGHDSTYSLVCPISGYDEVSANVAGVNLFDKTTALDGYIENTDGTYHEAVGYKCTDYIKINGGDSYYIVSEQTAAKWGAWYDKDKAYISGVTGYGGNAITAPNNATYMRLTIASTATGDVDTFAVNTPSTATAYEPYQGQTYTADLGQTVYGGTVDLVSGEVVIDRAIATYSSVYSVAQGTSAPLYYWMFAASPKAPTNNVADLISDQYVLGGFEIGKCYVTNVGQLIVAVPADQTLNTKALADAWLAQNPVQFCYKLATPQTIQLTPQEIQTLVGTNNVWSEDATHIRVIFTKSLTEETQFNVGGLFSASYRAEDECGNETIITRLINVGGVQAEALENENGIALQTEDGEVLIYVAPTEPVNDLVGSAYVGISEVH